MIKNNHLLCTYVENCDIYGLNMVKYGNIIIFEVFVGN